MNNRGQSLVTLIVIIPLILLVLYAVYEIGRMTLLRNELDGINYLATSYLLDNLEEQDAEAKTRNLILKNKDDIDNVVITINEDKVYITLREHLDAKTSLIQRMGVLSVKSAYAGYWENEKKIIERDK